MSGRRTRLPAGAKIEGGKVIMPEPKPRDASQARSWAKGGKKKWRPLKKGLTDLYNSIGKKR